MDTFRHRGNPQLGETSSCLLAGTSTLQTPVRQDKHSPEMINMKKICGINIRRSSSLNQNRSKVRLQLTRQSYHTAPVMSNGNFPDLKIKSPDIQADSSPLEHDSFDVTYVGKKSSILTQTVRPTFNMEM